MYSTYTTLLWDIEWGHSTTFFHRFQGQTSDNELLHWMMMMMLGSAAFVIGRRMF